MTAHKASSSSSSQSKLRNHDVFLNFRGVDTRNGFTGHLHAALKDRGCKVYIDEDDLKRGEEINEGLFRAIEGSRISIIVFSKRYAESSWCLDELVKIMECRSKLGQHVLPIFYHVDPSDVRKQKRVLAKAFKKHKKDIRQEKDDKKREAKEERVKQWRKALTEAANLSGHHLQITDNGHEAKLIREIVDKIITEWLRRKNKLNVSKHPVGICGMGGLGKTTAAEAIYNQIHPKFQFKSFLADVSDTSKLGLARLKQNSQISSVAEGISSIKKGTCHRGQVTHYDSGVSRVGRHLRVMKAIIPCLC